MQVNEAKHYQRRPILSPITMTVRPRHPSRSPTSGSQPRHPNQGRFPLIIGALTLKPGPNKPRRHSLANQILTLCISATSSPYLSVLRPDGTHICFLDRIQMRIAPPSFGPGDRKLHLKVGSSDEDSPWHPSCAGQVSVSQRSHRHLSSQRVPARLYASD
ncbi:hypothetical protein BD311DRAFT_227520 [Dichomitus squalens]|uniref:Uncharacterized protein n=1 Tax=Dichomitus squalens TaxID=114155 RepID=A0A4Q9M449_9APHY|nr:hypothetical protein BD311DRAFT_227520 [Dichomitus squalens]